MWGIFMVFESTIRKWGWGISQNMLYTFIEVGKRGGDWTRVHIRVYMDSSDAPVRDQDVYISQRANSLDKYAHLVQM